jgi:hypothetical protein
MRTLVYFEVNKHNGYIIFYPYPDIGYRTPRRPTEAGRTPCESPASRPALLLVAWESYMTPSRPTYTKIPPQIGGNSYVLIEK